MSLVEKFEKALLKVCQEFGVICSPNTLEKLPIIGCKEFYIGGDIECIIEYAKNEELAKAMMDEAEKTGISLEEHLRRVVKEEVLHCEFSKSMLRECRDLTLRGGFTPLFKEKCHHLKMYGKGKPIGEPSKLAHELVDMFVKNVEEFIAKTLTVANTYKALGEFEKSLRLFGSVFTALQDCVVTGRVDECREAIAKANLPKDFKKTLMKLLDIFEKTNKDEYTLCQCLEKSVKTFEKWISKHVRKEVLDELEKTVHEFIGV